jgi:predicted Zn-dependent protease
MRALVAMLLATAAVVAGRASAQGVYGSMEITDKEREALIEKSALLHGVLEQHSLLYSEPRVQALVADVGRSLAPAPTDDYQQYRFFVLRDPSPNAFALPNGDLYVHTGMLARLADTAQLAAVLEHELNHVAGHHAVVDYRSSNKKIVAGMVLGGMSGWGSFPGVMAVSLQASIYGFSRSLEQEADDRAVANLRASPYDSHAIPEVYELLAKDYEGLNPRRSWLSRTHPLLEARAKRTREQVADAPAGRRDAETFDEVVMPIRTMTIRDYILGDYPRTAVALAEQLSARYPADAQFVLLMGDAWVAMGPRTDEDETDLREVDKRRNVRQRVVHTRQEREAELLATPEGQAALADHLTKARDAYQRAIALDADTSAAYRGLGDVAQRLGDNRAAAQAYVDYLQHAPGAEDQRLIVQRLRALRETLKN